MIHASPPPLLDGSLSDFALVCRRDDLPDKGRKGTVIPLDLASSPQRKLAYPAHYVLVFFRYHHDGLEEGAAARVTFVVPAQGERAVSYRLRA
jgi:hypothetical protein